MELSIDLWGINSLAEDSYLSKYNWFESIFLLKLRERETFKVIFLYSYEISNVGRAISELGSRLIPNIFVILYLDRK